MRYNQIRECDIANGEGIGVALFVQGCPSPHCKNCFNPETWNFNGGKGWTNDVEEKVFELADAEDLPMNLAADRFAEERIDSIRKTKRFFSKDNRSILDFI